MAAMKTETPTLDDAAFARLRAAVGSFLCLRAVRTFQRLRLTFDSRAGQLRDMRLSLVIAGLLCVGPVAGADVFKCAMPGGKTEYQSSPCVTGKSVQIQIRDSGSPALAASAPGHEGSGQTSALATLLWPRTIGVTPEIIGSDRFQSRVRAALNLLATRDADAYDIVTRYIGRIEEASRSGMRADGDPPTFLLANAAASVSVAWAAAVIAHDSYHSKLYFDYRGSRPTHVPPRVWGGVDAEVICMRHQIAVMRRIGASKEEIDHAMARADGRYVDDSDYNDHDLLKLAR